MNGVIVLDKPEGFTSFDAVAVVRGLSHEKKIGHTGTLDPMATGVLPLLLGRAAKAAELLPDTDKIYQAAFRLGEQRDTGDVTGQVVRTDGTPVPAGQLEEALPGFRGEVMQVPPVYSAVSVNGRRLYELARKGIEVERQARPVTIFALELLGYDPASREGQLLVSCSKGTYIRVLIEDLARAMGTVGTMTALRRTAACGFTQEQAVPLDTLRELAAKGEFATALRPVDSLFAGCPRVTVSPAQAARFANGGSLDLQRLRLPKQPLEDGALFRVYGPEDFLGVARVGLDCGQLRFAKLLTE